jgi:putative PEP-CTERM system TPR-repeat lipoprotein
MNAPNPRTAVLYIAACFALVLTACGGDSRDALIAKSGESLSRGDAAAAVVHLKGALKKQDDGQTRFLLGKALLATGESLAAQNHLRQAMSLGHPAAEVQPELARALSAQGEFRKLVQELGNVDIAEPALHADLRSQVGEAYLALGQNEAATAAFESALRREPGNERAAAGMARLMAAAGDANGALRRVDDILARQPKAWNALGLRADLLTAKGQTADAIAVLETMIRLAPANGTPHANLVTLLISSDKLDAAKNAITQMRKDAPRDNRANYLDGLLALRNNEPVKARDAAVAVLNLAPDHAPARLLAGAAEYQLGSLATSADHLRKVVARHPGNGYARNLLVSSYLRQGQAARADEVLQSALAAQPQDPALHRTAGEIAIAANRLPDAKRHYEKAAELEKNNPATVARLAQLRLAAGETERALLELEGVSGTRGGEQADLTLIASLIAQKQFARAEQAVLAMEKKRPDDPLPLSLRATVALARNDARGARNALENALTLRADFIPALRVLAELDLAEKKLDAASSRLEALVAKEPSNEAALLALADVLRAANAPRNKLAALFDNAIRSQPKSVLIRLHHGRFLREGREANASQRVLDAARAANAAIPNEPRLIDMLGLAQLAADDVTGALESFGKMAELQPDSAVPQIRLAAAGYKAKKGNAPIEALRKALALQPDLIEAQRGLVSMLLDAGRADEAMKEAKAAQRSRAGDSIGFALEAEVHERQSRPADAAKAYAEGMKRRAEPELVVGQLRSLEAAGQLGQARAVAEAWFKKNPDDPVVRFHVATAAMLRKDYRDAAAHYRTLLKTQPNHPPTLNNLAWVLGELNEPDALPTAEKALAQDPESPNVLDTLGWLLVQKGAGTEEAKRGTELLTRAVAGAPNHLNAKLHLAEALIKIGDKAAARKVLAEAAMKAQGLPAAAQIEQLMRGL